MTFTPMLDVLPEAQRALWPSLGDLPDSLVLYGGTALALRLGHRSSVDFDFFSSEPLDVDALLELPGLAGAEVLQRQPDTLTVSTKPSGRLPPVKASFFGGVDTGRVGEPQRTDDGVVLVASLLDLFGTKLKVLLQRVAARDYLDLAAILRSGVPLEDGLGAAAALYGHRFPPMEAVKALAYFDEGEAAEVDAGDSPILVGTGRSLGSQGNHDCPRREHPHVRGASRRLASHPIVVSGWVRLDESQGPRLTASS